MLPKRNSRIIRLFISSTFIDMDVERQLIQREVVPKIKEYCLSRGWQFEVVDLRWGVSSEAAAHHKTMRICLNELEHCKEVSPKPNFLLLLGQRYGWIPLPETIIEEDALKLLSIATEYERNVFDQWYVCDYNALPYTYELRSETEYDKRKGDDFLTYSETVSVLMPLFNRGRMIFGQEWRERYCASATEQEIINGLFHCKDLYDNTVCYNRSLSQLPDELKPVYVEDEYEQELKELRNRVSSLISNENIYNEDVSFEEYKSDSFRCRFVKRLIEHLKSVVSAEIDASLYLDDQYLEELGQKAIVEEVSESFVGRQKELDDIEEYLKKDTENEILVLNAEHGSGKTALLAKFVHLHAYENPIYRFIGNSLLSSDGIQIIRSLLSILNVDFNESEDYISLSRRCAKYFRNVKSPQLVVLDGFDYLRTDDLMLDMSWLPNPLPKNLKVIVSKTPQCHIPCLASFNLSFLKLSPIEEKWFEHGFRRHLVRHGRCLSMQQRNEVIACYRRSDQQMLLLPVLCQQALEWHSYDKISLNGKSVEESIAEYIDYLCNPERHDSRFVVLVLGLLCYSQCGITEDEILDITALDNIFYNELLASSYHRLDRNSYGRRTPYVLWSKLFSDLKTFLTPRKTTSGVTYSFVSHSIARYVQLYLKSRINIKSDIYDLLLRYYEQDSTYSSARTLEELSYVYFYLGKIDELADMLCNPIYVQAKCAHGMTENLCNEIKDTLKKCTMTQSQRSRLESVRNFLLEHKLQLIKYARYGDYVSRKLKEHYAEIERLILDTSVKRVLSIPITHECVSSLGEKFALICCCVEGDSDDSYSTCILWNLEDNVLYSHIDIPLKVYQGRNSYSTSHLECSTLSSDGKIAAIYDSSCVLWLWNTESNHLSKEGLDIIAMDFCGKTGLYYLLCDGSLHRRDVVSGVDVLISIGSDEFKWLYTDMDTKKVYVFSARGEVVCYDEKSGVMTEFHLPIEKGSIKVVYFDAHYHQIWFCYEEQPHTLCMSFLESNDIVKSVQVPCPLPSVCLGSLGDKILCSADDEIICFAICDGSERFRLRTADTYSKLRIGPSVKSQFFFSESCYTLTLWQWVNQ